MREREREGAPKQESESMIKIAGNCTKPSNAVGRAVWENVCFSCIFPPTFHSSVKKKQQEAVLAFQERKRE